MAAGNAKNLKKGDNHGNKGRGTSQDRKDAAEVRKISRKLILDPAYQRNLTEKLRDGTAHPSVQSMLWYFAFGKPVDTNDDKPVVPVNIEMVLHPDAKETK